MIDFNGTTSKLENTTAAHSVTTLVTMCAWIFADSAGEGSAGRIICLDENFNSLFFKHATPASTLGFSGAWTTFSGSWEFPATDGQWNAAAVSYDAGSTGNDPIARVGFTNATVTETGTPSGTFTQPSTGYCIGNDTAQSRTWDGLLAYAQIFNVVLTAREMDQALRRPGSVRRGLRVYLPMLHAGYLADLSGNQLNGTGTDLTNRALGAPCSPLLSYNYNVIQAAIAAAGGARTLALLGAGRG